MVFQSKDEEIVAELFVVIGNLKNRFFFSPRLRASPFKPFELSFFVSLVGKMTYRCYFLPALQPSSNPC